MCWDAACFQRSLVEEVEARVAPRSGAGRGSGAVGKAGAQSQWKPAAMVGAAGAGAFAAVRSAAASKAVVAYRIFCVCALEYCVFNVYNTVVLTP